MKQLEMITPEMHALLYPREAGAPDTYWLPLPVLLGASYVLDKHHRGQEIDLLVRTESGEDVPVMAQYGQDERMTIKMGEPIRATAGAAEPLPSTRNLEPYRPKYLVSRRLAARAGAGGPE